jgi:uncharacterized protein
MWQSNAIDHCTWRNAVKAVFVALLLGLACLDAAAAPPSPESLDRLLKAMDAEQTVKNVQQYGEAMTKGTIERVAQVRPLTPEQRKKLDAVAEKQAAVMRDEMSWATMKPMYVQIYSETFTQEEIDGLIAFYESPAGRAFISKMPMVLQKSMSFMQNRMDGMMQKMQGTIRETLEEK